MQSDAESSKLPVEDYQAIEDAVMETARGRWFLAEYARRHRVAETEAIVGQLERLEKMIRRERQVPDIDRIRLDLADMAEAIHRTKAEIAQMQMETGVGGRFAEASSELDAIVTQTETATNDILLNAEKVQEMAWSLREAGVDDALCDQLDQHATEIYTACSFQDLTGQRTRKVVTVLRYLESRINSMIGIWGLETVEDATVVAPAAGTTEDSRPDAHLLNGPARLGEGIDQSAVDDLMDFSGTPDAAVFAAVEAVEAAADPVADAMIEAETEAPASAARPLSTADFEIRPRRIYDVIDDDVTIVVPDEVAFAEPAASAAEFAGADVFARRDAAAEPPVFAEPAIVATPEPAGAALDFDAEAADVFAPSVIRTVDPAAQAEPEADVFAQAPAAAPPSAECTPSDVAPKPRSRGRITKPAVHGNTALAVAVATEQEPETDAAPAPATAEPVFAVVPNADPIAALSPAEKLIVFG